MSSPLPCPPSQDNNDMATVMRPHPGSLRHPSVALRTMTATWRCAPTLTLSLSITPPASPGMTMATWRRTCVLASPSTSGQQQQQHGDHDAPPPWPSPSPLPLRHPQDNNDDMAMRPRALARPSITLRTTMTTQGRALDLRTTTHLRPPIAPPLPSGR
ncbi:hypothetical protein OG21DRAFT_1489928 [Imleria badia]|nr:hypothetical protein OG21DRAFT_1489928 [Imleria badia]